MSGSQRTAHSPAARICPLGQPALFALAAPAVGEALALDPTVVAAAPTFALAAVAAIATVASADETETAFALTLGTADGLVGAATTCEDAVVALGFASSGLDEGLHAIAKARHGTR